MGASQGILRPYRKTRSYGVALNAPRGFTQQQNPLAEEYNLAVTILTMSIEVPRALRNGLRDYQRDAVGEMSKYIATFDARHPRAGLVQMPTGSGKTGVIATLGRCETRSGPVVVIAPRIGVREQLARYIDKRFFEHAKVDLSSLRRRVLELEDGAQDPGSLDQLLWSRQCNF